MESLGSYKDHLEELQQRDQSLTSTALSLVTLFTEEANRLNREDEALYLKTLLNSITEQLKQARYGEDSTEYATSGINLIRSLSGLAMTFVAPKNEILSNISRLSNNSDTSRRPFGKVMVCIGSKGLPGDVTVVSISDLARESNRTESQVINELLRGSCLLFDEKTFSLLIDKLIEGVLQGQMSLPISRQTLSEMKVSSEPGLRFKKIE